MFTGIIEEVGKILSITEHRITIEAKIVLENIKSGDSIAVNGVCLTVVNFDDKKFSADLSPETCRVTTFGELRVGDFVNLERALLINGRLGGHIVSGHVDGKGKIISMTKHGDFYNLSVSLSEQLSSQVVKKGSITLNGISLTVADVNSNIVTIAVIPHTFENTALMSMRSGDFVNIETDILAKYVEKFLSTRDNRSGISVEFLQQNGF